MRWMSWTPLTAGFFAVIGLMLAFMTTWEARSPSPTRRGLIPLSTTRGDRLFIGLLSAAYINLAWIGFTSFEQWWALAISVVVMALIGRFG
jgi:predicted small integral membrane protein